MYVRLPMNKCALPLAFTRAKALHMPARFYANISTSTRALTQPLGAVGAIELNARALGSSSLHFAFGETFRCEPKTC